MDFQTPKFWGFTLLNNHYQISKYEGKKFFKPSAPAYRNWLLHIYQLTLVNHKTS